MLRCRRCCRQLTSGCSPPTWQTLQQPYSSWNHSTAHRWRAPPARSILPASPSISSLPVPTASTPSWVSLRWNLSSDFHRSTWPRENDQTSASPSSSSSPSPSSSPSSSSSSSPQYWRKERIFEHLAAEQRSDQPAEQKEKKLPKPSLPIRMAHSLQRFLLNLTSTLIDLVQHPSHLLPLLAGFWSSVKSTSHHYWTGTKLLAADVRTAYRLARKTTRGHTLTRRERRQLQRTTTDLIRLVPFSIFVVVPFMELLLPLALKLFPSLLPSTFQDAHKKEEQLKRELQLRLNVASFLQDTVESMAKPHAHTDASTTDSPLHAPAHQLLSMLKAARSGQRLTTGELVSVAKLFDDAITFDNLTADQLRMVCRYLRLQVVGGEGVMRYAIHLKMQRVHRDDELIKAEGMDRMSDEELRAACRARGMRDFGLTREGYMRNLQQWLDLSLDKKIPDSLLLLSRAMSISEEPSAEDIAGALTSMSEESIDELAAEAGISDNDQRLAIVRRQNELIAAEDAKKVAREKEKEEKKAKAKATAEAASGNAVAPSPSSSQPPQSTASDVAEERKEEEGKEEDDDEGDLGSLAEGLLSMTQRSSVEEERKRLQALLSKMEEGKRKEKERELVKQMRPSIDQDEPHPIQTINDLADWHVQRLQEAEQRDATKQPQQQRTTTDDSAAAPDTSQSSDAKAKGAEGEEEEEETEEESDSARKRLSAQLESMLNNLRDRVVQVDSEIGERLHLLHPSDPSGLVDDDELAAAIMRLQRVDSKQVKRLIGRIKQLARERKERRVSREGQGQGEGEERGGAGAAEVMSVQLTDQEEMELNVEDVKRLAELVREESAARSGQDEEQEAEKKSGERSSASKGA